MNTRRLYLKAIRLAAGRESMTDGLRVIKRFERVNNVEFNPRNRQHLDTVKNNGQHENFFRRARKAFKAKAA